MDWMAHTESSNDRFEPEISTRDGLHTVFVSMRSGPSLHGTVETFNPSLRSVLVYVEQDNGITEPVEVAIDETKFIGFLASGTDSWRERTIPETARVLSLRLSDGEVVTGISHSDASPRRGLFLLPTNIDSYEFFYIPIVSIREILSVTHLERFATEGESLTFRHVQRALNDTNGNGNDDPARADFTESSEPPLYSTDSAPTSPRRTEKRIGEILFQQGFVSEIELAEALTHQRTTHEIRIGDVLLEMGLATFKMIGIALAIQHAIPFVELSAYDISDEAARLLPEHVARRWQAVPIAEENRTVTIAVIDPTGPLPDEVMDQLKGFRYETVVATPHDIDRRINTVFADTEAELLGAIG